MAQRRMTKSPARPAAGASLDDVKRRLRRVIETEAGIPAAEIHDESTVDGDLAMDSMSFLAVQVAVEDTFGINCSPEEILAANRFATIATLVQERTTRGALRLVSSPRAGRGPEGKRVGRSGEQRVKLSARGRR
jgi:acyl carrier protein